MLEGMYSAAAGMAAQQQRLDALSNDIANVNTTGYKRVRVAFRDLVYTPAGLATGQGVRDGSGAAATQIGRGAAQGALTQTGEPLDIALQGPGYLGVRSPAGERVLTRDGHLRLDDQRRLVTASGLLMAPPITVPRGVDAKDVKISDDGRVFAGNRPFGRLAIVTVAAPEGLAAAGDNLYRVTAQSGAARAAGRETTVAQGALEASNVEIADAMVDMLEAQRAFQLTSEAIKTQDQVWQIANGVKK